MILSLFKTKNEISNGLKYTRKNKSKVWWKKKSGIAIFIFALVMITLSYFYPELDENLSIKNYYHAYQVSFYNFCLVQIFIPFPIEDSQKIIEQKSIHYLFTS